MSAEKKIKLGFIGCGGHATTCLFPVIRTIPEVDLVAVCDLQEELAKRNARTFGVPSWYTDLETMCKKEQLQGVIICGPPQMFCCFCNSI